MNKQQRLNHARNNEEASKALRSTGKFNDWVITTSFYSGLHYLNHYLFPMEATKDGRTVVINTIEQYINHYGIFKNKHKAMCDLAYGQVPEVSKHYNFLMDQCMQARYVKYKFDENLVKSVIKSLEKIKEGLGITEFESNE